MAKRSGTFPGHGTKVAKGYATLASGRIGRLTLRGKEFKDAADEAMQGLHHRRLGQMAAGGLPIAHAGQAPTLRFIGEASDHHPQQPGPGRTTARGMLQPQLHQERAALAAGAPARQMKGEIEAFLLGVGAGLGIVAPGGEIGACIREVLTEQHCNGRHRLRQLHGSNLLRRVHAVAPAAELRVPKT